MRVLLIAYHYPPVWGSSGVHRTFNFARYLQDYGWRTAVLSVHPRAFPQVRDDGLTEASDRIWVKRAFAVDTARHLALLGRYPGWLAWPDRWISWWLGAVPTGLYMIKKFRPQVLWSTYPIATAHLVGLTLSKIAGLPWVADFRDSMTEENYPAERTRKRIFQWIERRAVFSAARAVFTSPGTVRMYHKRYPQIPSSRWALIPNGYDEEAFCLAEKVASLENSKDHRIVLIHSGIMYPSERDPTSFFEALADLKKAQVVSSSTVKVVLRATGHDDKFWPMLAQLAIDDIVTLEPGVSYQDALVEMLNADGLLLFQATNCNHQTPAKLYEYLRAKRPILTLADPKGDTANMMRSCGIDTIVNLHNKEDIKNGLMQFITLIEEGKSPLATDEKIKSYSRRSQARVLSELLRPLISTEFAE